MLIPCKSAKIKDLKKCLMGWFFNILRIISPKWSTECGLHHSAIDTSSESITNLNYFISTFYKVPRRTLHSWDIHVIKWSKILVSETDELMNIYRSPFTDMSPIWALEIIPNQIPIPLLSVRRAAHEQFLVFLKLFLSLFLFIVLFLKKLDYGQTLSD